ncbi:methyltransferase domain-containing protein [archaeon]|nr:methyltransferase domain-containing protein [archaeon]MBT4373103.1 methyltransferase domain-containing protein [archaeon]MBT4531448.1 methyltransferase domain-containing protein [archaeon]MBT7001374.1 methyltransferase domain-containing protein [archaeon]MBT7282140.1 methyltransferase domain-containing protein [archaeon]
MGCGGNYLKGWINLDIREDIKADKIHNLEEYPYPFKKNQFNEILVKMVLEHVKDPIKMLNELTRISKNRGRIKIIVPHATSYANFSNIVHKINFTEDSFQKPLLEEYELKEIILKKKEFIYQNKWKRYLPFKNILKIFFMGIYDDLFFEFEVKK